MGRFVVKTDGTFGKVGPEQDWITMTFNTTKSRDHFIDVMFKDREFDEYESPGVFVLPSGPFDLMTVGLETIRLRVRP